jgi:hypothetical protein
VDASSKSFAIFRSNLIVPILPASVSASVSGSTKRGRTMLTIKIIKVERSVRGWIAEMGNLQGQYKQVEKMYGQDMLNLVFGA